MRKFLFFASTIVLALIYSCVSMKQQQVPYAKIIESEFDGSILVYQQPVGSKVNTDDVSFSPLNPFSSNPFMLHLKDLIKGGI